MRTSTLSYATLTILPLIHATSPPTCPPSSNGYQAEKLFFLYKTFCNKLSTQSFSTSQLSFTGSATDPWISLGHEPLEGGRGACSEESCGSDYSSLLTTCKSENHTIFGAGTLGTPCGTYNFTIYSADFQPGDDGTTKPSNILEANPSGSVVSSIEGELSRSFGLTGTKVVESVALSTSGLSTTSVSSTTVESTSTSLETTPSSTTAAPLTTTTSSSPVIALSTGIVTNETITTSGPFGNSTAIILTTSIGPQIPVTRATEAATDVEGSVTGAPVKASSTNVNSMGNSVVGVAGWRLMVVGLVAMLF